MNQRDGVYECVKAVVGEIKPGVAVVLTDRQVDQVRELLVHGFMSGDIELKGEKRTAEYVTKYVGGLLNNWLRKDPRLNGGGKYEPKNPGSRTGSGDETLKALKALLTQTTDPEARQMVQQEINKRLEELKPKPQPVDMSKIPEHLRHLVKVA